MKRKNSTNAASSSVHATAAATADDAAHATAAAATHAGVDTSPPTPPPPPAKKKRVTQPQGNLTNAQKRMLCVKFAQVKMTQQELCVWAKDEFALPNLPHQSTISKILARAGELTTMPSKDLSARRRGLVTHPELDTALCNWVLYARQNNLKLSGDMIKDKARQLAASFGISSTMTFSNGWLGGFKKRHNIRLGGGGGATTTGTSTAGGTSSANASAVGASPLGAGVLGNAGGLTASAIAFTGDSATAFAPMNPAAAAAAAAAAAVPVPITSATPFAIREIQECAKLYHASNIFTMSETGLFYALSPEKTSGRGGVASRASASAAARKRLTIVLAANADGSEQLEPFFIGSTKLPSKLLHTGLDGEECALQFQYRDNKKAWMTPVLFQEWIGLLDTKLRDDQRNILLLIAHAPSHIRIGLELTNIRLEMLPPSTTSQHQPFEAGVFDAFKRRYRRHHLHHALDRFEAGLQDDIFDVDLVQAMRWVRECWLAVPQTIVKHYWDSTEITSAPKPSPQAFHAIEDAELTIENEICDAVSALAIARPMTIEEFLSPGDENMSLHCLGTDESDFIHSVGDNSGHEFDAEKLANELRLMDAVGAAAADAGALSAVAVMTPTTTAAAAAVYSTVQFGSRTTNEQLLECFKTLLPELDRLRFDDHTKNSIRLAFRKLKEKASEHATDTKQRQAVRRAMMPGQHPAATAAQSAALESPAPATAAQLLAVPESEVTEKTVI